MLGRWKTRRAVGVFINFEPKGQFRRSKKEGEDETVRHRNRKFPVWQWHGMHARRRLLK